MEGPLKAFYYKKITGNKMNNKYPPYLKYDPDKVENVEVMGCRIIGLDRFAPLLYRAREGVQGGNCLRPIHARVGNTLAVD